MNECRQDVVRRFPDLFPSEGDVGSSSTNLTLVPIALPRPFRRLFEALFAAMPSARSTRPANGVYNGVAGVVEACARTLARAARLDGEVM